VIQTVEHLLSAVMGLGIDNLYVEVDGPEIPILDGSASPFVSVLKEARIVSQGIGQFYMKILKTIEVKEGNKRIWIEPYPHFKVQCSIEYPHSVIGRQSFIFRNKENEFEQEIAGARTFCFLHEIEALWNRGVARGGSLENAIVVGEKGILNENGLRFEDEFARHKVLDLLGDLFLIGMPVIGKVVAERGGHALHTCLVSKILSNEKCWKIINPSEQEVPVILPGVESLTPQRLSL
jgi:UDP-3-O-[3-hydroxymyristoyl] N-acetylglucosamine deacetylase